MQGPHADLMQSGALLDRAVLEPHTRLATCDGSGDTGSVAFWSRFPSGWCFQRETERKDHPPFAKKQTDPLCNPNPSQVRHQAARAARKSMSLSSGSQINVPPCEGVFTQRPRLLSDTCTRCASQRAETGGTAGVSAPILVASTCGNRLNVRACHALPSNIETTGPCTKNDCRDETANLG